MCKKLDIYGSAQFGYKIKIEQGGVKQPGQIRIEQKCSDTAVFIENPNHAKSREIHNEKDDKAPHQSAVVKKCPAPQYLQNQLEDEFVIVFVNFGKRRIENCKK